MPEASSNMGLNIVTDSRVGSVDPKDGNKSRLSKARVQLLNETTGQVIEDVDVVTSAVAVQFDDKDTFQTKYNKGELTGPVGPIGPQGVQGIQGIQGVQGLVGPQGTQGPIGPIGPQGIAGPAGVAYEILTGETTPSASVGKPGDIYITTDSKVFKKNLAGTWDFYISIKGIQGPVGPQGPSGPVGDPGAKGDPGEGISIDGSVNSPTELPAINTITKYSFYLVNHPTPESTKPHIYFADIVAKAWIDCGDMGSEGPQGPPGEVGPQGPPGPVGGSKIIVSSTQPPVADTDLWFDTTNKDLARIKVPNADKSAYIDTINWTGQLFSTSKGFAKATDLNTMVTPGIYHLEGVGGFVVSLMITPPSSTVFKVTISHVTCIVTVSNGRATQTLLGKVNNSDGAYIKGAYQIYITRAQANDGTYPSTFIPIYNSALPPKPEWISAADRVHTHLPADITTDVDHQWLTATQSTMIQNIPGISESVTALATRADNLEKEFRELNTKYLNLVNEVTRIDTRMKAMMPETATIAISMDEPPVFSGQYVLWVKDSLTDS